jgi:N12 class adenine-specific DNA methylase
MMPRSHQVAAVTWMIGEPAVPLAHKVGAGRTTEMIMGVTGLRRLELGLDALWDLLKIAWWF